MSPVLIPSYHIFIKPHSLNLSVISLDVCYFIILQISEIYMKEKKRAEMETKEQNERERELDFQEYYNNYKEAPESVFNLDGINFLKFNHRKIKFIFVPSNITKYISKKSKFICILKYNINQWYIGNNTLPCNCKTSVYRKYCFNINYNITDENIIEVLCGIYEHLRVWCQEHETFRLDKRKVSGNKYEFELILYFACSFAEISEWRGNVFGFGR